MDRKVLNQYRNLLQEQKDIERRIQRVKKQMRRMEEGAVVSDTVSRGKKGKNSLGTVKIVGFPDQEYHKKMQQMYMYSRQLDNTKRKIDSLVTAIEAFISGAENSYIRLILRYRYLDGDSWEKVAAKMGGGNTADGCRMAVERYLQRK